MKSIFKPLAILKLTFKNFLTGFTYYGIPPRLHHHFNIGDKPLIILNIIILTFYPLGQINWDRFVQSNVSMTIWEIK